MAPVRVELHKISWNCNLLQRSNVIHDYMSGGGQDIDEP